MNDERAISRCHAGLDPASTQPLDASGLRVKPAMTSMRHTLRALALLLGYPDARLRELLPALADAIDAEGALPKARRAELRSFIGTLQRTDGLELETGYVELFDRGRATSLHLFEHVHGDSRERGPAMIDLTQTYEQAGLLLGPHELPDHLCVVLEFASTQPPAVAREFLGEMAHILNAIFSALRKRESRYASVVAAVLELGRTQGRGRAGGRRCTAGRDLGRAAGLRRLQQQRPDRGGRHAADSHRSHQASRGI